MLSQAGRYASALVAYTKRYKWAFVVLGVVLVLVAVAAAFMWRRRGGGVSAEYEQASASPEPPLSALAQCEDASYAQCAAPRGGTCLAGEQPLTQPEWQAGEFPADTDPAGHAAEELFWRRAQTQTLTSTDPFEQPGFVNLKYNEAFVTADDECQPLNTDGVFRRRGRKRRCRNADLRQLCDDDVVCLVNKGPRCQSGEVLNVTGSTHPQLPVGMAS